MKHDIYVVPLRTVDGFGLGLIQDGTHRRYFLFIDGDLREIGGLEKTGEKQYLVRYYIDGVQYRHNTDWLTDVVVIESPEL